MNTAFELLSNRISRAADAAGVEVLGWTCDVNTTIIKCKKDIIYFFDVEIQTPDIVSVIQQKMHDKYMRTKGAAH